MKTLRIVIIGIVCIAGWSIELSGKNRQPRASQQSKKKSAPVQNIVPKKTDPFLQEAELIATGLERNLFAMTDFINRNLDKIIKSPARILYQGPGAQAFGDLIKTSEFQSLYSGLKTLDMQRDQLFTTLKQKYAANQIDRNTADAIGRLLVFDTIRDNVINSYFQANIESSIYREYTQQKSWPASGEWAVRKIGIMGSRDIFPGHEDSINGLLDRLAQEHSEDVNVLYSKEQREQRDLFLNLTKKLLYRMREKYRDLGLQGAPSITSPIISDTEKNLIEDLKGNACIYICS